MGAILGQIAKTVVGDLASTAENAVSGLLSNALSPQKPATGQKADSEQNDETSDLTSI